MMWFLGGNLMNAETLEWTAAGKDIVKVNREIIPLRAEIARIGNPSAVYSTPITKTLNNDPLPDNKKQMMPPGLDKSALPVDFFLQPSGGEFVMGVFKYAAKLDAVRRDRMFDAVFLANHNAYVEQDVALKLAKPRNVSQFDRKSGKWQALKDDAGNLKLRLVPGGGELLRIEK